MRYSREYKKYKRVFHPISGPVPGDERAGTTGRTAQIRATSLRSPRAPLLATTALPFGWPSGEPMPGARCWVRTHRGSDIETNVRTFIVKTKTHKFSASDARSSKTCADILDSTEISQASRLTGPYV